MRHLAYASIACTLVTSAMPSPAADRLAPGDGFYNFAEDGDGTRVERLDGARIVLREQVAETFGEASIVSTTNDNSAFRLDFPAAGPFAPGADTKPLAAVVGGRVVGIWSHSDPDEGRRMEISGTIDGREHAVAIARALGTEAKLRHHPGHLVLVTLRPEKQANAPGEAIALVLRIENVGPTTFTFLDGGQQRGARNNQFGFTAFRGHGSGESVPDVGDPLHFGGIGSYQALKPGDVFEKTVDLAKWFRLDEPDTYEVTAYYELELQEGAGWDDFVVGRCLVRVEVPE